MISLLELAKPGGLYLHHKGGTYLIMAVAETHNHNGDLDVVYVSLSSGKVVTRPLRRDSRDEDAWTDTVRWPDGLEHCRFESLERAHPKCRRCKEPVPFGCTICTRCADEEGP